MSDKQVNPAIPALHKMSPWAILVPGSGPLSRMWHPDVAPGVDGCDWAHECLWKKKKKQVDADTYQMYVVCKLDFG